MRKQPQITEQTRANLCLAFWDLYTERPIDKISVREITERAGYNRATFYLYFHDVYEMLELIEDHIMGSVEALLQGVLAQGDTLDFSRHMDLLLAMGRHFRGYVDVLLGEHGDPRFTQRLKDAIRPLVDHYLIPSDGIGDQEREILMEFYLSGLVGAVCAWIAEPEPVGIDQFIDLLIQSALHV